MAAANALFCVAIGAFATSEIIFIKDLGVKTALAVIIDATLIRAMLVPALMALLGRRNWWAPAPLRRLHRRAGMTESLQGVIDPAAPTERIFSRAQAAVTGRRCPSRPRRPARRPQVRARLQPLGEGGPTRGRGRSSPRRGGLRSEAEFDRFGRPTGRRLDRCVGAASPRCRRDRLRRREGRWSWRPPDGVCRLLSQCRALASASTTRRASVPSSSRSGLKSATLQPTSASEASSGRASATNVSQSNPRGCG